MKLFLFLFRSQIHPDKMFLEFGKLKKILVETNITQYAIGALFAQVFIMLAGNVSDAIFLVSGNKPGTNTEPLSLKVLRTIVMAISALIIILMTVTFAPPN